jgi:drug/metabolite transporter (DMT)-like permease
MALIRPKGFIIASAQDRVRRTLRRIVHRHTAHLSPTAKALVWSVASGLLFNVLNATVRALAQNMHPFQAQFLRYLCGLLVLLPMMWRYGIAAYRPQNTLGQFTRGALHTLGLCLWFIALPKIPLADMTAIGFTTPLFIMLGAFLIFKEPMRWERWVATGVGFIGVMVVVGPQLMQSGQSAGIYHLVMLGSAPLFAASFLLTKALTRYETVGTILVWQAFTVALISLPLAMPHWQPITLLQGLGFVLTGALGSSGHYCLTRAYKAADISATQSVKFLDLVWSGIMGWLVFGDLPTANALMGGAVIAGATLWLARREA